MGVSPSGQDEDELRKLAKDAGDYFISARTNKKGDMRFDMLTMDGWLYHDLPWEYEPMDDARYDDLKKLIKDRVAKKTYHSKHSHNSLGKPKAGGKGKPSALDAKLDELGIGGLGLDYPAGRGEGIWTSGSWDEWDEYYELQQEDPLKHLNVDEEGNILGIEVDVKSRGVQWKILVTEEDMLNAEVDPDLMMWAPYEINFDHYSVWFVNGKGHHRSLHFSAMA